MTVRSRLDLLSISLVLAQLSEVVEASDCPRKLSSARVPKNPPADTASRAYTHITATMLGRLFGRAPKRQLPPFDFSRNRFRAKKHWPPNLRELTEKQQFRFERKYKRRLRLKSIKPQWQKWIKIVQWNLIGFIVVYGVLFHDFSKDPMNPKPGEQPFQGLRSRMWAMWDGLWSSSRSHERSEDAASAKEQSGSVDLMGRPTMDMSRNPLGGRRSNDMPNDTR